ncbi:MAG: aspartyl protease family protein [Candidatus Thermoplasmatota archaeon]|nr:aspartyl protease family protein [Candidatus Thermoplasmatota archaeon]
MIFPYVLLKGKYLPIIPLELKGKEWIEVRAFVDTGASYSIFHSDIAEILGLDYKSGKKDYLTVGDGSVMLVYKHNLKVRFCGQMFTARIGLSKSLGIGFNIMGMEDFFDRFVFCFDNKLRELRVD